jgi:subtilase family serine protease
VIEQVPNLVMTDLDDPPAELLQNQTFDVNDTIQNTGPVDAGAFMVKYYLVSVADESRIDLKNKKPVTGLASGQTTPPSPQTVRVRPETPPGTYYLEACADSGNAVPEPTEDDNCLVSHGTVVIKALPDLVVNRVTVENMPVTVARGASFTVTSVVRNQGLGDAGSSFTKFYLVATPGATTKRALTGPQTPPGTQSVPPLPSLTKKGAMVLLNVEEDTPVGTYYVLGCADEANKSVTEKDENNNCTTSLETITVQ